MDIVHVGIPSICMETIGPISDTIVILECWTEGDNSDLQARGQLYKFWQL